MAFEEDIASLNEYFFYKEFTYSNATFRPNPGQEVELADTMLWIGDKAVVYQLKERESLQTTTTMRSSGSNARCSIRQHARYEIPSNTSRRTPEFT
jgi:hypothetical protein